MDIKRMINSYTDWLKQEISVASFGQYTELTTPYLDRFNDYLQIYVKMNNDGTFTLTDDGYIIGGLIASGITFRKGSKRFNSLMRIAGNHNVSIIGEEITVNATLADFPQKKHLLVQSMLSIDDLFVVSPENVKEMFLEDIEMHFNANHIYFSKDLALLGKTGTVYNYHFHFQKSKDKPERFCNGISRLTVDKRDLTLQHWRDTQDKRGTGSELIVIYNDEFYVSEEAISGFRNYPDDGIKTVAYSERQNTENLLLFAA